MKTIAIVSLSSGIIGESFVSHEVALGEQRLKEMGLSVSYMPHAKNGLNYVKAHPEDRASDLIAAFSDDSIDMILCAIGGDDTYRLLPYLFENDALKKAIHPKVFLGFSDSTINHLMLHKLGLPTFYGQSFLADVCELSDRMLPYSERYFRELITTGTIEKVTPSDLWYEERSDFSPAALGTDRISHKNQGFELLQGSPLFYGPILGGCIDTLYDIFDNTRYADSVSLCRKYDLFPSPSDWRGKILLLETSEEKASPEKYRRMVSALKDAGIFCVLNGVLMGKPIDECYADEYKQILLEVIDDPSLPVVANINIGHATPRCILPFGIPAEVDVAAQCITFLR